MGYIDLIKFPCDRKKNGKYVDLSICERCFYKKKCDTYQSMILEQDELYEEDESE